MKEYMIGHARQTPGLVGDWSGFLWGNVEAVTINNFHSASADHRPKSETKAVWNEHGIHVIFRVDDQYVRCLGSGYGANVWEDSCVEFFVAPSIGKGYFNFEFNCGGALHSSYIVDPTRTSNGFRDFAMLNEELCQRISVFHSAPAHVEPEITSSYLWHIEAYIPFSVLESFVGPIGSPAGQIWRGNFFKCGDKTSHPHWASWSPIGEALNFHVPEHFGLLHFVDQ
jgi:hypothetical protein